MFYSWIYVFVNAFSALLRQMSGDFISPALLLLVSCVIAVLYFHLVNLGKLRKIYQQCLEYKKEWAMLSLLVTVIWLAAIYSPIYLGASLYTFIFFAISGILGTAARYHQGTHRSIHFLISMIGLLMLVLMVTVMNLNSSQNDLGIFLAFIGGIAGFIYSMKSSAFMKSSQLSASQVLAVRFYLTMLACCFFIPAHAYSQFNLQNVAMAFMISLFCLIIPLYFVQKGIEMAGPERNAIIASTVPLIACVFEQTYYHHTNTTIFIICILYSLFTCWPYLMLTMNTRSYAG